MIFDDTNLFSDDQNVTSTGASTNVIDLGSTGTPVGGAAALTRDIGKGKPIPIVIQLTKDASGTSPTLDVKVQESTDNSTWTDVASAAQISGGTAGDKASIHYVPRGVDSRYVRLHYTVGGTSPDYTITAGFVMGDQSND